MRCSRFVAWGLALSLGGLTSTVLAADGDKPGAGEPRKSPPSSLQSANSLGKTAKQQALLQFDTNGDGKLDQAERQAARMAQLTQKRLAKTAPKSDAQPAASQTPPAGMGGSPLPNPYANGGAGYMPSAGYPPNARPGGARQSGSFYYWGGYYTSDGNGTTFTPLPGNYPGTLPPDFPGPLPPNFPPPLPPR